MRVTDWRSIPGLSDFGEWVEFFMGEVLGKVGATTTPAVARDVPAGGLFG